jgi:hypothetical protein
MGSHTEVHVCDAAESTPARIGTVHQLAAVITGATTPTKPKPPCAANPGDWDLDTGTPDIWQEAVRTCHGCLILAQCREFAGTLTVRGTPPRSMIWAGVAYDGSGEVIENLDQHRVGPVGRRQLLRIVRTEPVYPRPDVGPRSEEGAFSASPRRTVVLRRAAVGADR